MRKRFLRNIFLLSAFVIIVTAVLVSSVIYRQFYEEMQLEVRQEAERISQDRELDLTTTSGRRVTHIAPDGRVLYDSEAQAEDMENHMEREEIKEAFASGEGEASRLSATLGIQTYYYAVRLEDGSVIRVAAEHREQPVYAAGLRTLCDINNGFGVFGCDRNRASAG